MDNLFMFRGIYGVKHIYIPDGLKLDNTAYELLHSFIELETISISSNHLKPFEKTNYKCEIRESKRES